VIGLLCLLLVLVPAYIDRKAPLRERALLE